MSKIAFANPAVEALFANYTPPLRKKLLALRQLIFEVAQETKGVGPLEEALRWGEPSYLTTESKSGSIIRINAIKSEPDTYAIYFHCHTTLVLSFRRKYPKTFKYRGNRAIIFHVNDTVPTQELKECIASALTYFSRTPKTKMPMNRT